MEVPKEINLIENGKVCMNSLPCDNSVNIDNISQVSQNNPIDSFSKDVILKDEFAFCKSDHLAGLDNSDLGSQIEIESECTKENEEIIDYISAYSIEKGENVQALLSISTSSNNAPPDAINSQADNQSIIQSKLECEDGSLLDKSVQREAKDFLSETCNAKELAYESKISLSIECDDSTSSDAQNLNDGDEIYFDEAESNVHGSNISQNSEYGVSNGTSTSKSNDLKTVAEMCEAQLHNEHLYALPMSSKPNDSCKTSTGDSSEFRSEMICKKNKNDCILLERQETNAEEFVFTELSKEETGFPEFFEGLVKIGKYALVRGDVTLCTSEALIDSPSLVTPFLLKKPDKFPNKLKETKSELKNFFHSNAGEFLIGIGLGRVSEWFHKDMVRIKKRQLKRDLKDSLKVSKLEELNLHEKLYSEAKKANIIFSFTYKKCDKCGFTTESSTVMEGHLLVPHVTSRREYQCNFCSVIQRDPKEILCHMESEHNKLGRIQPSILFYECPYCVFDSNSKVKLNTHLYKCQKYFDGSLNQAPAEGFELPTLTPKPITASVIKAYGKSLHTNIRRGRGRPKKVNSLPGARVNSSPTIIGHPSRTNVPGLKSLCANNVNVQNSLISSNFPVCLQNMNLKPVNTNPINFYMPQLPLPPNNRFYQVVNSSPMPFFGNNLIGAPPPTIPFLPNMPDGSQKHLPTPSICSTLFANGLQQPNIRNITDSPFSQSSMPKLQGPYPLPLPKSQSPVIPPVPTARLVVCEICDGYLKDLEQLRTHMQLIHKVKLHPKMLVSRPPLNCQKCLWRFFTDQGLERHLLGAHGLVTSNMQELANKNKDSGCCTVCGRVYATKLVSHVNQAHKITLKPAHLSYKCTVCSATFNLYRLFENHVYLAHSGSSKRLSDGNSKFSDYAKSDPVYLKVRAFGQNKQQLEGCIKKCVCNKVIQQNMEKCEKCLKFGTRVKIVKIKKENV